MFNNMEKHDGEIGVKIITNNIEILKEKRTKWIKLCKYLYFIFTNIYNYFYINI
jgi:hypothetical protein